MLWLIVWQFERFIWGFNFALYFQGAIMAVGASKPTVLADKDGFFSVKNKMLVSYLSLLITTFICLCTYALEQWTEFR